MKSPKKPPRFNLVPLGMEPNLTTRKPAKHVPPRRPTKGQVKRGNDWLKP